MFTLSKTPNVMQGNDVSTIQLCVNFV